MKVGVRTSAESTTKLAMYVSAYQEGKVECLTRRRQRLSSSVPTLSETWVDLHEMSDKCTYV